MKRFWSGLLLLGTAALPAFAQAQEDRGAPETKEEVIAAVRARAATRAERNDVAPRTRFQADTAARAGDPRFERRGDRPGFDGQDRARPRRMERDPEDFGRTDRDERGVAGTPTFGGVDSGGRLRPDRDPGGRPDDVRRFDRGDRAVRRGGWGDPRFGGGDDRRPDRRFDGRADRGFDGRVDRGFDGRDDRDGRWYDRSSFGARDRAGVFRPWNRDWRQDDRYDWSRYRQSYGQRYRLPRYYAPSGWAYGYRRFGIGASLSAFLYEDSYWIDDPFSYRLPPAYGPYRWVRYYDDALLVDLRTGRVVDVVYDIFF